MMLLQNACHFLKMYTAKYVSGQENVLFFALLELKICLKCDHLYCKHISGVARGDKWRHAP